MSRKTKFNVNLAWKSVLWTEVRKRIFRVQQRIYKASQSGDTRRVHWLQKLLIDSLDAKLLAVNQVTTLNKGQKTAGLDRKKVLDSKGKIKLVNSLTIDEKARPIRRVWIPQPGLVSNEERQRQTIWVPTIRDRAKQALAKLALEPQWEAKFEPNSYGFRPGRSAHDAIESIFLNLHVGKPKWVFSASADADIRKCFDRISHSALLEKLETFPRMREEIQAWLSAGIMEGYAKEGKEVTPSLASGGIISPLLANIALHGLEEHLRNFVGSSKDSNPRSSVTRRQTTLGFVRYADDFLIIHVNKKILEGCIQECIIWLQHMGLELNTEKSVIRKGQEGFFFLGFQIIQVVKDGKYKVQIIPAKSNQKKFLLKVKSICMVNKSVSAADLILKLRPVIIGWANYFKYCDCKAVFKKLGYLIFQKLRAWVFRRDTRNGRLAIREKYFPSGKIYVFNGIKHQDNWTLHGLKKSTMGLVSVFLPNISWVQSLKFVKVKGIASPYDGDHLYWLDRSAKNSLLPNRVKNLLNRQKQRCAICKARFTVFDVIEVDHVIPKAKGGKDIYLNLQALHRECHVSKTANDLNSPLQEPDEVKVSSPVRKTR